MVTKRQVLSKLKITQLKEIAESYKVAAKGKKEDIIVAIEAVLKKDDLLTILAKYTTTAPEFNIFMHRFVPKHELLTSEEEQRLLEKYNCTKQQLPMIKYTDPGARLLHARPGNVLKITRVSPTAGKAIYYRLVTR